MEVLKHFAPVRYDAWEMAKAFNLEGKEKRVGQMMLTLAKDYKNVHMHKEGRELKYYYEKVE